jgi:hypothetical protein
MYGTWETQRSHEAKLRRERKKAKEIDQEHSKCAVSQSEEGRHELR